MKSATQYRELAEELRYRACLTPDPETREQLKVAAHDLEEIAQEVEDEAERKKIYGRVSI